MTAVHMGDVGMFIEHPDFISRSAIWYFADEVIPPSIASESRFLSFAKLTVAPSLIS